MLIHCGTAQEIEEMLKKDFTLVANLCFSATAEVFSNAQMLGGRDSISFKIKFKKVLQRTKQVIAFKEKIYAGN